MKKIIVILTVFALSTLWGQKEIPTSVGDGEGAIDERVNSNQSKSIDPELIQQIRTFKATKEKMHIKKEMINGTPSGSKSFKASNSESKFLAIKKIIEEIKHKSVESNVSSQEIMIIKSGSLDKDLELNDGINIKMNTKKINHGNK